MKTFQVHDQHTHLIGKIAKLTALGVILADEYSKELGLSIGGYSIQILHEYCRRNDRYELWLMFIDEPPITRNGVTLYWVKVIGYEASGDWYLFSLNQLMICDPNPQ